jgi:exopolysaccharide production protein ExoZ
MPSALISIQMLRAVAAIAVVIAHTNGETGWVAVYLKQPSPLPGFGTGAAGVDLFFVISGFIMVYTAWPLFGTRGGPSTFFLRRLVRIVPLYWFMTTVVLVLAALSRHGLDQSWPAVLASYFFIPWPVGAAPAYPIGWTLNYEMFFYVLFAASLALSARIGLLLLCSFLFFFGIYCGFGLGPLAVPRLLLQLLNLHLVEFAAGCLIGMAWHEGLRLPRVLAILFVGLGFAAIAADAMWSLAPREIAWGIPSAFIVAGAIHLEPTHRGALSRMALLLGDASYSIYLLHPFVMMAVRLLALSFILWIGRWPWLHVAFLSIFTVGVSVLFHVTAEGPVTEHLRSLVRRYRHAPARLGEAIRPPAAV